MKIKNIGIVGCGQMGGGIVQVCAQAGYQVVASETNDDLLNTGLASINSYLNRSVEKQKITQHDKDAVMSRIKGTIDVKDFGSCDLIIEAVVENLDLKKKIFADLDRNCPKHAILTTNTSCLSITDMAMATSRPDKVLGLHFFNPAPVLKLLEIVITNITSDETLKTCREFGESVGKKVIIAKDSPGFIVNRLMTPQILHAISMLENAVASREDIDTGVSLGLNHPMGPLALADFIGLDTLLNTANGIYMELNDPQFMPPMLLKKMVATGWLGRKSGKGFYEYV
ncbi:3-hydroxyacyl-CoA dehydrogenase family protein [Chloroflexota bacterium]